MFKKLSYPGHQTDLIKRVELYLNSFFYDVNYSVKQVLNPLNQLKEVQTNTLKELYIMEEDKYLRYDHTHLFKGEFNQVNFGPVFRKQPISSNRYREFHQYDVDYMYENHGLRPLLVLIKVFKNLFPIRVNDTTYKDGNLKSYMEEKYPILKNLNLQYDPSLIRTTGVYEGFIFQVGDKKGLSVCGGGIYYRNNKLFFGFGIGVNRFLNALIKDNKLNDFFPISEKILVYYKENIPLNLLEQLELNKLDYILKKKQKNLKSDSRKIKDLISHTLIVSDQEDISKKYNYKKKNSNETITYNLKELIKVLS